MPMPSRDQCRRRVAPRGEDSLRRKVGEPTDARCSAKTKAGTSCPRIGSDAWSNVASKHSTLPPPWLR